MRGRGGGNVIATTATDSNADDAIATPIPVCQISGVLALVDFVGLIGFFRGVIVVIEHPVFLGLLGSGR